MNNNTIVGLPKILVAKLGTKDITENGTYNAVDDGLDGYSVVTVNVSGGGGITTNEVIRAMDLSRSLIDKNVILTESDYTEENIKIMTDLMDVTVGGI